MKTTPLYKKILALLGAFVLALSFVFAVVGFFPTTAKTVSAEEVETVQPEKLSDDNFAITQGMATNDSFSSLRVEITLKNPALNTWLMEHTANTATALFSVYRYNGVDVAPSERFEVLLLAASLSAEILPSVGVYVREVSYDDDLKYERGFFDIYGDENGKCLFGVASKECENFFKRLETDGFQFYTAYQGFYKDGEFFGNMEGLFPYDRTGSPKFSFGFKVGSCFSNYFVKFKYGYGGNGEKYEGTLTSSVRSVNGVLSAMKTQGALEKEFNGEKLAQAETIISNGTKQTVKVEYLEEIAGTYLGQKKTATVSVPIYEGRLAADDVATALRKDSMRVHNSYVRAFVYDSDQNIWRAEYLKSVWLKTRTVDGEGHTLNMFLDVNKSFADYYSDLKDSVSVGADLYEYMFNQLKLEYPVLDELGLHEDQVYGYFGQIWVPKNNAFASFNAAAAALFNINTEELGFITSFKMTEAITYEEHTKLMTKYGYNWLRATWEKVTDLVTGKNTSAEFYFFVAKPMEYVGISQTGDASEDDDDGVLENVARDPLGSLGDALGDFFGLGEGVGGVIERVASLLIVLGIAAGVIYIVLYFKTGGAIGGSGNKRKRK